MNKLIHLILVVILTALFIITITSGILDTSLHLGFTLFYGAVLGGVILTLVWGLWTKASGGRVTLATLLSFIPLLGPWIAFFILKSKSPQYAPKPAARFEVSTLWATLWRGVLALIGSLIAGVAITAGLMAVAGAYGTPEHVVQTVEPTATPHPAMQGRLLWLAYGEDASLNVYQYTFGQGGVETLVTGLPHDSGCEPEAVQKCHPPAGKISDDGRYLLLLAEKPENIAVVDLSTGERKPLSLPGVPVEIQGAFSPGNEYLAYALTGSYDSDGEHYQSGLYLYDLSSGETRTLYESPCAKYGSFRSCGGVLHPNWIDATTLLFNGRAGEMPVAIRIELSTVQAPAPNRTFIIATDGTILQEFAPVLGATPWVQGATILVQAYSDDYESCRDECSENAGSTGLLTPDSCVRNCVDIYQWFDMAEIKQGIASANQLVLTNEAVLSVDGSSILHWAEGHWHLLDLRSSSDPVVQNLSEEYILHKISSYWSPDGKFIAYPDYYREEEICLIQISSIESYPDFVLTAGTRRIELLGWLP